MPKVIDLFCGAGGFSLGFKLAGFEISLAVDRDLDVVTTYKANFVNTDVMITDLSRTHSSDLKIIYDKIDVIIASPPCEAYTLVNKNIMPDPLDRLYTDIRGRLMLDTIRLIGDLKPDIFVIENVPGILIKPIPEYIKRELNRVGYEKIYFNLLNAADYGTPSFRRRVFISNIKIKPRKRRRITVEEALTGLPDPKYPNNLPNHVYIKLPKRYQRKIYRLRWNQALDYYRGWGFKEYKQYIRLHPNKIAPTIMGRSRFIHPFEDRIITVREEARLMGYPDKYVFYGGIDKQFNQVGESVPPPLSYAIAKFILEKYFIQ